MFGFDNGFGLQQTRQNQLSLNTNNNISLQYDCLTLEDLINSQEFNYSAKGAWDKSFEGGFKREEGVSFSIVQVFMVLDG